MSLNLKGKVCLIQKSLNHQVIVETITVNKMTKGDYTDYDQKAKGRINIGRI